MKRTKAKKNVYAVVLAGGAGTRLWPFSFAGTPKQLLKIAGPESLLKATIGTPDATLICPKGSFN